MLSLLFAGLLCSQWLRTFTFGAYEHDKAGFTLRYCENITKPNLKCQGSCHLKKLLAEQSESDKGKSASETEGNLNLFRQQNLNLLVFHPTLQQLRFSNRVVQESYPFIGTIFHPPSVREEIS